MADVFISRKIFNEGLKKLEAGKISYVMNEADKHLSKEQLIEQISKVRGLICLLTDNIDDEVMAGAPDLKVISNVAVGYNNIDIAAATKRGIMVTNTPDVLTDTTAELAFALMISAARRLVEADKYIRQEKYMGWELMQPHLGMDLRGKVLGVVGMGRVGQSLARSAMLGFNMKIIYFDAQHCNDIDTLGGKFVGFDQLLKESDFISVHVPLTPQTRHMFGEEQFKLMKPTAIIVNTSRGPVIDEQALADAIASNRIGGAGIDVYEYEPKVNPDLLKLEKHVVLAPHIGSATLETRVRMSVMAAQNMACGLKGENPPNLIKC